MQKTDLMNDVNALNLIYSSDKYGDFVRKFVKSFKNNEYENEFSISENGKLVLNVNKCNLGYFPTDLNDEERKLFTSKTMTFFTQFGAFSYSQYEVTKCNVNDMITGILRSNELYAENDALRDVSKSIIMTLIKDMVV